MDESQQINSIRPYKLANKEAEVKYHWLVSEFSRLCSALYSDEGQVSVVIHGYFDQQKRCLLEANLKATLMLECQTTFEPIEHQVDKNVTFCAVASEEQFASVDTRYEPVLTDEGYLDIAQVIEDELILSVPIAANKPSEEITQEMSFGKLDEDAIAAEKRDTNPFSALKNFKKT